ncbi:Translocator protein-like protein [Bienertia sinuspersici]
MQPKNLKQRNTREGPTNTAVHDTAGRRKGDASGDNRARRKKMIMAKRGLKSLSVALSLPLILTLTNIYMFGANDHYKMSNRPNWVPPIWALHTACLGSALLLGLCGWIVWAEGGFHKNPNAFGLYVGQFGLSLLWDPLVFKMGANWAGLVVAAGVCWALFRCYKVFRAVSEIAADLVLPCLGWAALLAFISVKLLLT